MGVSLITSKLLTYNEICSVLSTPQWTLHIYSFQLHDQAWEAGTVIIPHFAGAET